MSFEDGSYSAIDHGGKPDSSDPADISLCPACHCMTHTVAGACGKCRAEKADSGGEGQK